MKNLKVRLMSWFLIKFYKEDKALDFIKPRVKKHRQGINFWNQVIYNVRNFRD